MRVLQICNGFAWSKVHSNLFNHLDQLGIEQIVYCPTKSREEIGKNCFESNIIKIVYSYVIKPWYKYVYYYKQKILYKDLCSKINIPNNIDIIHASTLFTDGGVAYKIYKKYKIPYVVAVRGTDVNAFGKLLPHTWINAVKILLNAKKIYFISKGLQEIFEQLFFVKPILKDIKYKFELRPNGIDNYWLSNIIYDIPKLENKILYIGNFSPEKNVVRLIEAINELRNDEKFTNLKLTIIGGGNDKNNTTHNMINQNCEFVTFLGKINDKTLIKNIMNEHSLFAMPSIHETFGLVYIEALTQNLPVIYTKKQGIDNFFSKEKDLVGIDVNPYSISDIRESIEKILLNRNMYSNKQVDFSEFDWEIIAKKYTEDYKNIIELK